MGRGGRVQVIGDHREGGNRGEGRGGEGREDGREGNVDKRNIEGGKRWKIWTDTQCGSQYRERW